MKQLSPLKSIKKYCKEQCCLNDMKSWKDCTATGCLLYRYRLGLGNRTSKRKDSSTHKDSTKIKAIEPEQTKL